VQAFSSDTGEPGASFQAHEGGSVAAVALGKKTLFTGGLASTVRAFARSKLEVAREASSPVTALAARGELVAVGDAGGHVRLLRGDVELTSRALGEPVLAVHVAREELLVVATARLILGLPAPWSAPRPVALRAAASAFATDEDYAFAGTDAGTVDVYDLSDAAHVTSYALSDGDITQLARLPGRLLVVGTGALDGRVFVVDVTEAKVVHRLEPHDEAFGVTCLVSDARGRIIASGADDGSIALIDPSKGKVLARLRVRETPVSLAFDGDGRSLACVFADGTAGLVKLGPKGATIEELPLTGAVRVAWGDAAVVGFADGRVERLSLAGRGRAPAASRAPA
jgi:hypothetical protein